MIGGRALTWSVVAAAGLTALTAAGAAPAGAQAISAATDASHVSVPLPAGCENRSDVIGLSRVVEIDTSAGPHFGESQYKGTSFLADGEVVLTFDDGPMRRYTLPILDALDAHCTRATFFAVGRMALADPETLQETARRGHTIGSHTWSHQNLKALSAAGAKKEVELGISAISAALGAPIAPFFRFPYLGDSKAMRGYLGERQQGIFSIDVDSRDFKTRNPGAVLRTVVSQLRSARKGILLFHDIQPSTAGALQSLLADLKENGFKVVHIVAKSPAATLPEYDAVAEKALARKKLAMSANPLATRAVNWPQTGAGGPEVDGESLPWVEGPEGSTGKKRPDSAAKPTAAKPSRDKPSQWRALEDNPWQIRSFGLD